MNTKKSFINKIILPGLIFAGLLSCFSIANAVEYGQMGGRPAHPDSNVPESDAWFIYSIPPGQSKEDAVLVMNLYEQDWDAHVYAADSVHSAGGGFALKQEVEEKHGVGSWVRFYPEQRPSFAEKFFEGEKKIYEVCAGGAQRFKDEYQLEEEQISEMAAWCEGKQDLIVPLKSQERREIPFVITIPENADVGEHTGGILIQKVNKEETKSQDGSRVMLTTRVGVRIYETVPGEIIKKLSFEELKIEKNFSEFFLPWDKEKKAKQREYVISSVASNEGNSSIDFSEKIIIKNKLFGKEEIIEGRKFQVLRSDKFSSILAWKAPFFGWLSFSKQYEYADADGNLKTASSQAVSKLFIPWFEIILMAIFLIILAGIYFIWRYFQKKRYGGIGWEEYEVGSGETIIMLAQKFGIHWKVLARTNKLKEPYLLEAGQVILAPAGHGIKKEKSDEDKSSKNEKDVFVNQSIESDDVTMQTVKMENGVEKNKTGIKILRFLMAFLVVSLIVAIGGLIYFLVSGGRVQIVKKESSQKNIAEIAADLGAVQHVEPPAEQKIENMKDHEQTDKPIEEKKEFSIAVLNGGAAPGTAAKVGGIMEAGGFKPSDIRNADEQKYSGAHIFYISEAKNEAEKISQILDEKGFKCDLKETEEHRKDGDITVLLGK